MYYIGIDGGGAYSRLVAFDTEMNMVGRHAGNTLNIKLNSYNKVLENIVKLLTEFNRLTNTALSDCAGLCIGSAGIHTPRDTKEMESLFSQAGVACPIKAVNAAELIIAAETKGGPGIAVISGTSSMGYAVNKSGRTSRSGGWGHLIDDEGSGYWIGIQAVKCALLSFDGRSERTVLTDKIKSNFRIKEIDEVTNFIYSGNFNKAQIAELALLVKYAAAEGDQVAIKIEKQAAESLVGIAKSLIIKNEMHSGRVVLSGNALLMNDSIKSAFINLLKKDFPNVQVSALNEKPEVGAMYLAMKK